MSSDEIVIDVKNLSKRYEIYATPRDRLKQLVFPSIYRIFARITGLFGRASDRPPPRYFREFWALHDVSFQVRKGETVGIVGLNGSGKSTLLQLICSTLTPTSGNVEVKGRVAALLELGSGFNPDYTGRENVFLNGQILGLSREEIQGRFQAIEDFADIGDFIDQPVKTYSSGMTVRLAFAVAINVEADILVVDEALAVGDFQFQAKCYSRLRSLRESGVSILFVTHATALVRSFCDKAIYLRKGELISFGNANEVCSLYESHSILDKFKPLSSANDGLSLTEKRNERASIKEKIRNLVEFGMPKFANEVRSGSGGASIEAVLLCNLEDELIEAVSPVEDLCAYVLIKFNRNFSGEVHVGLRVHDLQGSPIMVIRDTGFRNNFRVACGDRVLFRVQFDLPLMAGNYYLDAGISLFGPSEKYVNGVYNFDNAEISDLLSQAAFISVLPHPYHAISIPVLNKNVSMACFNFN